MVNHPNRGWRARWSVNLETATAAHRDGWVFKFQPAHDCAGAFDGQCVGQPNPLTKEHLANAARVAREAGDIFMEVRSARN